MNDRRIITPVILFCFFHLLFSISELYPIGYVWEGQRCVFFHNFMGVDVEGLTLE